MAASAYLAASQTATRRLSTTHAMNRPRYASTEALSTGRNQAINAAANAASKAGRVDRRFAKCSAESNAHSVNGAAGVVVHGRTQTNKADCNERVAIRKARQASSVAYGVPG